MSASQFLHLFRGDPANHYVRSIVNGQQHYQAVNRGITLEDVERHLSGREPSLLSIPIDQTNHSHFGALDIDRHGDSEAAVDHAALAHQVTELNLPLVVCRSKSGRGAWLFLFLKENDGLAATDVRRLLDFYRNELGLPEQGVDIFPRQEKRDGKQGNGINLPYFGNDRVAFGLKGEELDLTGFVTLAEQRAAYGKLLLKPLEESPKLQASTPAPEIDQPVSKNFLRQEYSKQLEKLRKAPKGDRNNVFNQVTFTVARIHASGALEKSSEDVRAELKQVAQSIGLGEGEIRATGSSGWTAGIQKPYTVLSWRDWLRTGSQLEAGNVTMYVDKILPEGITAIGSLSGVGKTWLALSMCRALCTGTKFLQVFDVPEKMNVVYLVPEMGDKAVRRRIERLKLPMTERFYCQTVNDGIARLNDPRLEDAIAELKPIVFLDTVIRFNPASDENAARQNAALLANNLLTLRRWGARAVVFLHHSPKASSESEFMTLENVLRGTGDLGAMCDAVWGVQHARRTNSHNKPDYAYLTESKNSMRLYVSCVKPRDFEPASPFFVQGRPHLDLRGDLAVITEDLAEMTEQNAIHSVNRAIEQDPHISINALRDLTQRNHSRITDLIFKAGWFRPKKKGPWVKMPGAMPFSGIESEGMEVETTNSGLE